MKPDIAELDPEGLNAIVKLSPRAWVGILLLIVVMAVSVQMRWFTFWLPHWKGDQSQYITLAMKLSKFGFDNYNLRAADLRFINRKDTDNNHFIYPVPGKPGTHGDVLQALMLAGQTYYDEPFHHRAPLFPLTLLASHNIFAEQKQPFIVNNSNLGNKVLTTRPAVIIKAQFWAAIVPFTFGLLTIVMTFLLGRIAWGNHVAFYASLLMATNAMSLMTSYKLWAEESMAFCYTSALLIFYLSYEKKKYWGMFIAGIFGGMAVMYKQTTGLIGLIVWTYMLLAYHPGGPLPKKILLKIINPPTIVFGLGFALIILPWFVKITQIYGDPFYQPFAGWDHKMDITGWFDRLYRRPPPLVLYTFGVMYICPLLGLFVLAWRNAKSGFRQMISGQIQNSWMVFLWVWVLVIFFQLSQIWALVGVWAGAMREHRFFYMAYPALAIVAAFMLNRGRLWLEPRVKFRWIAEGVVMILLITNAVWSAHIGYKAIFSNDALLY